MRIPTPIIARWPIFIAAGVLLAGCAAGPFAPAPQPQPQPRRQPAPSRAPGRATPLPPEQPPKIHRRRRSVQPSQPPPPRQPKAISSAAVMTLLDSAAALARGGHMTRAAATLQRALDIEPRNPFIYQRLARVRLAQGRPGQAQALARKSNSLAVGNPFVRADNWALIAKARRTSGNQTGYRRAMGKVKKYRLQSAAFR